MINILKDYVNENTCYELLITNSEEHDDFLLQGCSYLYVKNKYSGKKLFLQVFKEDVEVYIRNKKIKTLE